MPTFFAGDYERKEHTMAETQIIALESDNPILNNPYEEPQYYYDTDANGNIDYTTVISGRRPYGYDINIVPKRAQRTIFSQEDLALPTLMPTLSTILGRKSKHGGWLVIPRLRGLRKNCLIFGSIIRNAGPIYVCFSVNGKRLKLPCG